MKKIILLFTLCFPIFLTAQLTSEDFESYTVGTFDGQWDAANWVGWFGGASNTEISDEQALSGMNSLKVEMNDDVVALLGDLNTEGYEVKFHQFIPAGNGAYFNLQHAYTNAAGSWMLECYATPDGVAAMTSNTLQTPFPIVYDEWAEISIVFNFITGIGEMSYNGTAVNTFAIATGSNGGTGPNQLNAINFFGACAGTGCTSLAYYDDISVTFIPAPPHNARVLNPTPPSKYTTVPNGLEQPITLAADVWNIGAQDITNVTVTFNLKDGSGATVYSETSEPTLATTLQVPFAIDDNIYAKDDGNYVTGGVSTGTIVDPILGQEFEFIDLATIEGIFFAYEGDLAMGVDVTGLIYTMDANGMPDVLIASTDTLELDVAAMPDMPVFKTLEFADGVDLIPGDYLFAVQSLGDVTINVSFSASIYTPESVWAGLINAGTGAFAWNMFEDFNLPVSLAVRPLISLVGVDVDESAVNYVNDLKISPNPTQDFVTIDLELLETQDLRIEVFNTHGQQLKTIVDNNTFGGLYHLNMKEFSNGIYFVKFQIGEQVISRRVVFSYFLKYLIMHLQISFL